MKISTIQDKSRAKRILSGVFVTLFWLGVWEAIYLLIRSDIIFASPVSTAKSLYMLFISKGFWICVANSISHILLGFALAVICAVILSAFTSASGFLNLIFSPIVKLIKSTPVASFIVIAILWLKSTVVVFISFLMVIPVIYTSLYTAIWQTDKKLLEFASVYKLSFFKKIKYIYIPSVFKSFISACSVGLGFAFKSAIAAEVISLPENSLGYAIYNAKVSIETADLFALTAAIIILSIITEKLFLLLMDFLLKKVLGGKSQ